MNAGGKDTRDQCANCCAVFGNAFSPGEDDNNRIPSPPKITTLSMKINRKDETVRVNDALIKFFRLEWFPKILVNPKDAPQNELSLCLDCFIVFSQLYKLFFEFQLLRKAESILSERLEAINSVFDLLLANSRSGQDVGPSNLSSASLLTGWQENGGDLFGIDCGNNGVNIIGGAKDEQDIVESQSSIPVVISALSLLDPNDNADEDPVSYSDLASVGYCSAEGVATNVAGNFHLNREQIMFDPTESNSSSAPAQLDAADDGVSEEILGLDCADDDEQPTLQQQFRVEEPAADTNLYLEIYGCVDCHMTFLTATELGKHRAKVHNTSEIYKCHKCLKVIERKHGFKLHMARHSSARPYRCIICSGSFKDVNSCKKHITAVHKTESQGNWEMVLTSSDPHSSVEVNQNDTSGGSLHVTTTNFESDVDQVFLATAEDETSSPPVLIPSLSSRAATNFFNSSPGETSNSNWSEEFEWERGNKFPCRLCLPKNQSFSSAVILAIHLTSVHTVDYGFHCTVCHSLADTVEHWKYHVSGHCSPNSNNYQCLSCTERYRSWPSLLKHRRTHEKGRRHPVAIPQAVGNEGSRERNVSSLRPAPVVLAPSLIFKCTDCDQEFHSGVTLGAHRSSAHQAVDPYKCHVCWESFPCWDELRVHVTGHVRNTEASSQGSGSLVQVMLSEEVETKEESEEPDVIMLD